MASDGRVGNCDFFCGPWADTPVYSGSLRSRGTGRHVGILAGGTPRYEIIKLSMRHGKDRIGID